MGEYEKARETLIDCLEALEAHRGSVVIVGAQAVYLQVPMRPDGPQHFTSDADVALIPDELGDVPPLSDALKAKGFVPDPAKVGTWSKDGVGLDVMVPEALGGPGRRGARLPQPHGKRVARKATGLEGLVVDYETVTVESLDGSRSIEAKVAGPAALIVAKLHKIEERLAERPDQLNDKDAHDIWRILSHIPAEALADRFDRLLSSDVAAVPTRRAFKTLHTHFLDPASRGCQMVGAIERRGDAGLDCAHHVRELLEEMNRRAHKNEQKQDPGPSFQP